MFSLDTLIFLVENNRERVMAATQEFFGLVMDGDLEEIKKFVEEEKPDINMIDENDTNALHHAIRLAIRYDEKDEENDQKDNAQKAENYFNVFNYLMDMKVDMNQKSKIYQMPADTCSIVGISPLEGIAKKIHTKLIDAGAKEDIQLRENFRVTQSLQLPGTGGGQITPFYILSHNSRVVDFSFYATNNTQGEFTSSNSPRPSPFSFF